MSMKTYRQLTEIYNLFQRKELSPQHPLIMELNKFEEIEGELREMFVDLQYTDDDDIEEQQAIREEIGNIEVRKKRQWSFLMESFKVNEYYHNYIEDKNG